MTGDVTYSYMGKIYMICRFQNKCAEYTRFAIGNCNELDILECDDKKIYEKIENKYMALR